MNSIFRGRPTRLVWLLAVGVGLCVATPVSALLPREVKITTGRSTLAQLAFSPDDTTLAGAFVDTPKGFILLWDVKTGKERATLKLEGAPTPLLAFSPNGKFLIVGGEAAKRGRGKDGYPLIDAELWDVKRKERLRVIELAAGEGRTGVITSTNNTLVVTSRRGAASLYDLDNGKRIAQLANTHEKGRHLAVSEDGKWLVVGHDDGYVSVWNLSTQKEVCTFLAGENKACAVAISPKGDQIATGDEETRQMGLWDLQTGKLIRMVGGRNWRIEYRFVGFGRDGTVVGAGLGLSPPGITVWDPNAEIAIGTTNQEPQGVRERAVHTSPAAITRNGALLATHHLRVIRFWDMPSVAEVKKAAAPKK